MHVIKAPWIGGAGCADRAWSWVCRGVVEISLVKCEALAPRTERARSARTRRVFPLRLCRQAVVKALKRAQALTESLCLLPAQAVNRQVGATQLRICTVDIAGQFAHDGFPLGLGHFKFPEVKALGQRY